MAHPRTEIRQALVDALSGLATCGSHVYASRVRVLTEAELPAILVDSGEEEVAVVALMSRHAWQRSYSVRLTIVVKSVDGFEATADTILGEIEAALFDSHAHNSLGGIALNTELASIGDPEMDDSTDRPVVRLPVFIRITYPS